MKLRLMAAAALVPVLLIVLLIAPKVLTTVVLSILCGISAYELLGGAGLIKQGRLIVYTAVVALLVPVWCHTGMQPLWALTGILLFVSVLFGEVLLSHGKLRIDRISICIMGGLVIPYLLSSIVRIMDGAMGRYLIMTPFVLAFLSDSGAYFVGRAWGRHKLAPIISPNKSIEGMFGGVATAILGMLVYCLILNFGYKMQVNYAYAITYGVIGSFAGVFGDLCFSAIKRQTGIKDYGSLIPGHGGILDRFDSMVIVAPLAEILLALLPFAE